MTTLQAKLKELRELAERLYPSWWVEAYGGTGPSGECEVRCHVGEPNESPTIMVARVHPFNRDIADFIAQSRTALPQLVTALEKALEALGELSSHSYYCVTEGKPTQSPGCVACEALSEIESLLLPPGGTK